MFAKIVSNNLPYDAAPEEVKTTPEALAKRIFGMQGRLNLYESTAEARSRKASDPYTSLAIVLDSILSAMEEDLRCWDEEGKAHDIFAKYQELRKILTTHALAFWEPVDFRKKAVRNDG